MSARILVTTMGSLGDLHPYIALGRSLRARGAHVTLATTEMYRAPVTAAGLDFHPLRPDYEREFAPFGKQMARLMDRRRGSERVIREVGIPFLDAQLEDTLVAAREADLLVSQMLTFATRIAAEKLEKPWASSVLAPMSFFSPHDPPVPPVLSSIEALRPLGPALHRVLFQFLSRTTNGWVEPVQRLRERHGLPRSANPLFAGQFSPHLNLALFSPRFGAPQPDWPARTVATGFPFGDRSDEAELSPALAAFLDAGPAPLVFTLGSAAVHAAGDFFDVSAAAAQRLKRRAVLLVGRETQWSPRAPLPPDMCVADYAPYGALFPRAAAIVHQGGIGTTAEALRSGRPMLVVPWSHDQFDNAARVVRLGIGARLGRGAYRTPRVAAALGALLSDAPCVAGAGRMGTLIAAERGADVAADAVLRLLD